MATNLTGAFNRLAGCLAVKLAQNLPVLLNTEQQVSKEVFSSGKAANGLTMNYVLPDYGQVLEGPTIDESKMNYTAGVVPVSLSQYNIAFSAGNYTMDTVGLSGSQVPVYEQDPTAVGGSVMTRNMLLDFEKQVKFPFGANFASNMQKKTIKAGILGSGTTVVLSAADQLAGKTLWDAFSEAASAIRNARSDDEVFGAVSPRMAARAARGAANLFHPGDRITKLWNKCELGEFSTATWYETADMGFFTAPAAGDGFVVEDNSGNPSAQNTVATAITVEGSDTITLGSPLNQNIPAGTPFRLVDANGVPIEEVDPLGYSTGVPFTFVVQEEALSGTTDIKVQKLYTTGALKNISRFPLTTDLTYGIVSAGKTYAYGLAWSKPGLATAWGQMDSLDGANNFSFGPAKGLLFYGASMADIVHRRNIWRLDALKGETVTMSNWVSTIMVEL